MQQEILLKIVSSHAKAGYSNLLQRYELDLQGTREVFGLITKGRASFVQKSSQEWVTHYRVQYTTDSRHAFQRWADVKRDATSTPEVFYANRDADSQFESVFPVPVEARYIRVFPVRWHKNIALRCGAICSNKVISNPASRTTSPTESADSPLSASGSQQHAHLLNLLQSDPSKLNGTDVEVYSVSAGKWMKGRILGIHDVSTGQVRVQYFVSASACEHGMGGQREKVVSINDPKLLRESVSTMQLAKPLVSEPYGTQAGHDQVKAAPEHEAVLIHRDDCPQVRVDVSHSISQSTGKDVYDVAILIGPSKVHSVLGT